jgi:hypothetical protein
MKALITCLNLILLNLAFGQIYSHQFSQTYSGPIIEDIGTVNVASNDQLSFMLVNSFGLDLVVNGSNQSFPPPALFSSYVFCKADELGNIDWVIDYEATGIKTPSFRMDSNDEYFFRVILKTRSILI